MRFLLSKITMEPSQMKRMRGNLPKLIKLTICSPVFLSYFTSHDIISEQDKQLIIAEEKNKGSICASYKLYDILFTRTGSFEVLQAALAETRQTGALKILQGTSKVPFESDAEDESPTKFLKQPEYISKFLKNTGSNLQIIFSKDCDLICEKILETVKNSKLYTTDEYLKFVSRLSPSVCSNTLAVINCDYDLQTVLALLDEVPSKVLVVTSEQNSGSSVEEEIHYENYIIHHDQICSSDLSPITKLKLNKKVQQLTSLSLAESVKVLQNLDEATLIQLLKNEAPNMFLCTIPDPVKYYIPRRLVTRNKISTEVFTYKGPDVFLIKGVERFELSDIVQASKTDMSSHILAQESSSGFKVIILEQDNHFDKLIQFIQIRPIHLLEYRQGNFLWLKTIGNISAIQQAVENQQDSISESDFLKRVKISEISQPICISDTPGMGKSLLLANIATKLQEDIEDGVVSFIVISELIEEVKNLGGLNDLSTALQLALQKIICANDLGVACFKNNNSYIKELLLDAFDELNAEDMLLGYECLKCIQKTFPITRLWVTARPHMLLKLEEVLQVMGYNIQSFEEKDQFNFLKLYWSRDTTETLDMVKLEYFGKKCLSLLKSTIGTAEEDFAGVPLQSLLIGEVYEDEALEYSQCAKTENVSIPKFRVASVADLYEELVRQKFSKFSRQYENIKIDNIYLKHEHYYYSIWLLFPAIRHKFYDASEEHLPTKEIYDVGIIEPKRVLYIPAPRFVHRTFAEYFVAKFIVESIHSKFTEPVFELLFKTVFETMETNVQCNSVKFRSRGFKNSVICYFIDALIGKQSCDVSSKVELNRLCDSLKLQSLKNISEACAYNKFEQIFLTLVSELSIFKKLESRIHVENFIILCTLQCSSYLTTKVYEKFRSLSGMPLHNVDFDRYTLLHFAVARGKYSIVEMLSRETAFRELLEKKTESSSDAYNLSSIVHECVVNSGLQGDAIVEEKQQIIKYLGKINKQLLILRNEKGELPILCAEIHSKLVLDLIFAVETFYDEKTMVELMHKSTRGFSPQEYMELIKVITTKMPKNISIKIFNSSFGGSRLIHRIIERIEPNGEMLQFMTDMGFSLDSESQTSHSLLTHAIKHKKSSDYLLTLIKALNISQEQLIDSYWSALENGNYDFIKNLINSNYISPNVQGKQGHSTLRSIFGKDALTISDYEFTKYLNYLIMKDNKGFDKDIAFLLLTKPSIEKFKILDLFCKSSTSKEKGFKKWKWLLDFPHVSNFNECGAVCVSELGGCNETDHDQNTMLHLAALKFHIQAIKFVLQSGANANCKDMNLNTPLHIVAAFRWSLEIWSLLLDFNADVFALNNKLLTPIELLLGNNFTWCDKGIIYALNKMINNQPDNLENVVLLIYSKANLNIMKKVVEWYIETKKQPAGEIKGILKDCNATSLDAVLQNKHKNVVEYFVEQHSSIPMWQPFGSTWIFEWLKENINPNIFSQLIDLGANVNAKDVNGSTPLHIVAQSSKNVEMMKLLISKGAKCNVYTLEGKTPLFILVTNDEFSIDCWKLLIDSGGDPMLSPAGVVDSIAQLFLWRHHTAYEAFIYALEKYVPIDMQKVEAMILSALQCASLGQTKAMCGWYKEKIGRPVKDIKARFYGIPPTVLDVALHIGDGNILEYLYEREKCFAVLTFYGQAHIYKCIKSKNSVDSKLKFIKLVHKMFPHVLEANDGSDLDPLSVKEITPDFVKLLVELGANIKNKDKFGNTALHNSINNENLEVAEMLIHFGADIHAINNKGETMFDLAMGLQDSKNIAAFFDLLINAGSDIGRKDKNGNTVIHKVPSKVTPSDFHKIVQALQAKGNLDLLEEPGSNSLTPLQIAKIKFPLDERTTKLLDQFGRAP